VARRSQVAYAWFIQILIATFIPFAIALMPALSAMQ
jgi:hypothetical protein